MSKPRRNATSAKGRPAAAAAVFSYDCMYCVVAVLVNARALMNNGCGGVDCAAVQALV
jgi:hypothetical protein